MIVIFFYFFFLFIKFLFFLVLYYSYFTNFILNFLPVLAAMLLVAVLTVYERKLLASMQRRRGPNSVGIFGLLQAIADAIKLLFKESIIPTSSMVSLYIFSPIISLTISILLWSTILTSYFSSFSNTPFSLLLIFALSPIGVYGVIMAGWSSNSKYPFLGALRSAAQLISYEVSMALIIMPIIMLVGSLNFVEIVKAQESYFFVTIFLPSFFFFLYLH